MFHKKGMVLMANKKTNIDAQFTTFMVKIFRMVPSNAVLVMENRITGTRKQKASGLRLQGPICRGKFVCISSMNIDYKEKNYRTLDGLEVKVDVSVTVHVEDPLKFQFDITDPQQELDVTTQAIIREMVANEKYENLISMKFSLSDPQYAWIVDRYKDFENLSGVHVDALRFQSLELADPETKRQFEAARAQERENAELIARANAEKTASQIRAQGLSEIAEKNMSSIKAFDKMLKKQGYTLSQEQIVSLYQSISAMHSQNPNVKTHAIVGSNGSSLENGAIIFADSNNQSLSSEPQKTK